MKASPTFLFLTSLIFISSISYSQDGGPKHENLGSNVNSTASELTFLISANGRTCYVVRDDHPQNKAKQDVWYSYKDASGNWVPAKHPGKPINTGRNASIFALSVDENQILMRGAYVDGEYESSGISVLTKDKNGEWGKPEKLEIKNFTKYSDMGKYNTARLSNDGKHLFFSFSDEGDNETSDIYVSHLVLKDKWSKPKSIKDFTKFVSKLAQNNTWTEPEKIKQLSLKGKDELGPYLASDGVTLYFSSNRDGGFGSNDIWMTKKLNNT